MKSKLLALICLVLLFFAFSLQAQTWRQFTKADGLPSDTFFTMINDREGNIWVGMPHAISRINGGIINQTFQISQYGVRFLMESSDGSIWVPTRPRLYRYDTNMKQQSFIQMRREWFYTMLEVADGTLWGASYGMGGSRNLWKFDDGQWEWVDSIEANVKQMLEDKAGNLW